MKVGQYIEVDVSGAKNYSEVVQPIESRLRLLVEIFPDYCFEIVHLDWDQNIKRIRRIKSNKVNRRIMNYAKKQVGLI